MKYALLLVTSLFCVCLHSEEASAVRSYADTIATLVAKNDLAGVYGEYLPEFKDKLSYEQFLEAARFLRNAYGTVTSHVYSKTVIKRFSTPQGTVDVLSVYYRITTDKNRDNLILSIDLANEKGHLYLRAYEFGKEYEPATAARQRQ